MENYLVFVVLGLLTGAAARLAYPGRRPTPTLGTMLMGVIGAVVGGIISWSWWVNDEFHSGNFILSVVGAMIVIALWTGVAFQHSLRENRNVSR